MIGHQVYSVVLQPCSKMDSINFPLTILHTTPYCDIFQCVANSVSLNMRPQAVHSCLGCFHPCSRDVQSRTLTELSWSHCFDILAVCWVRVSVLLLLDDLRWRALWFSSRMSPLCLCASQSVTSCCCWSTSSQHDAVWPASGRVLVLLNFFHLRGDGGGHWAHWDLQSSRTFPLPFPTFVPGDHRVSDLHRQFRCLHACFVFRHSAAETSPGFSAETWCTWAEFLRKALTFWAVVCVT